MKSKERRKPEKNPDRISQRRSFGAVLDMEQLPDEIPVSLQRKNRFSSLTRIGRRTLNRSLLEDSGDNNKLCMILSSDDNRMQGAAFG